MLAKTNTPIALMFDVFGTVVDWRGSLIRHFEQLELFQRRKEIVPLIVDRWRSLYQPSMEEVRSGARGWEIIDTLHRESLELVLDEFQINGMDPKTIAQITLFWHCLDPWPDAVSGLTRLKTKYTISTLSNGNTALLVNMAKHAGLPWDVILGAETAGAYKPLAAAYQNNIRLLGLEPEETMMVAAHNDDLAAAKSVGMRTAFVLRHEEYGPNQNTDLSATGDWDLVANDFDELATKMGVS